MPRPLILRSDHHPYHITNRCMNKEFFPLPLPQMWEIMLSRLQLTHQKHQLAIHAFVMMGNHFHLLCHTPRSNIDECMHDFMRLTSRDVRIRTEAPLWQGRYRWSLIKSPPHYYQVYRYIYQNPVRAQLVTRVELYPYSTLVAELPFLLHSSVPLGFAGSEGERLWLNEFFTKEDQDLIRFGLRKSQFDLNMKKRRLFNKLSWPLLRK
jgi:putative transposase